MSEIDFRAIVVAELTATAGDPATTLDEVYKKLGDLYEEAERAENQPALVLISHAWELVNHLSAQTNQGITIAAAAREAAHVLQEQRDEAVHEHHELKRDIETGNRDNPLVDELYNDAYEEAEETMMSSGMYVSADPADDMINMAEINVNRRQAEMFHLFISGILSMNEELLPDDYTRFCEEAEVWIADFADRLAAAQADRYAN